MRFECLTGCGLCCSYKVALLAGDIERIESLGYRQERFASDGALQKENGFCVFLDEDRRCSIYDGRPGFCRSFPFFLEDDGSIDVDLSCPGVGRGTEVEPVFEYTAAGTSDIEIAESLPGYLPLERFEKTGAHWCDANSESGSLGLLLQSAQRQARRFNPAPIRGFDHLFDVADGMNAHLSDEGITTYPFDLREERLVIGDHTYALTDEEMPGEYLAEVMDYLRVWFGRYVFYRFCLATYMSAPLLRRPMGVAFYFVVGLVERISEIRAALTHRWKRDDIETLREAIRAVDGRLRTKCRAARIETI